MRHKRFLLPPVILFLSLAAVTLTLKMAAAGAASFDRPDLRTERASPISPDFEKPSLPSSINAQAYTNTLKVSIPDASCTNYASSIINVTESLYVNDVNVGLNIQHDDRSDLKIYLRAPDGRRATLLLGSGGSFANLDVMLDHSAPTRPGGPPGDADHDPAKPYYDFYWRAIDTLGIFKNAYAAGPWTLELCDSVPGNVGALNFWSLWLELGIARADLEGSFVNAPAKAQVGDVIPYTIVVKNVGAASALYSSVTNPIPEGTAYVDKTLWCSNNNCRYDQYSATITGSGTVLPGEAITLTFSALTLSSTLVTDEVTIDYSGTLDPIHRFVNTYVAPELYFFWDFEADGGGFDGRGEWQWGIAFNSPPPQSHLWGVNLNDIYHSNTTSTLYRTVNLSEISPFTPLTLQWWDWYAIAAGDVAAFSINDETLLEITGYSDDWRHHEIDLTPYLGQIINLKWELKTDADFNDMGWYLDNVSIHARLLATDLSIVKQDGPDPAVLGETLFYTLAVTNNGPDLATAVSVFDDLPRGVIFSSYSSSQGTCFLTEANDVQCQLEALAAGQRATIVIEITPDPSFHFPRNQLINYATVAGDQPDPGQTNNAASVDTTLIETPLTTPVVISVTPQSAVNTLPTMLTIDGDNFEDGMTVMLDSVILTDTNFINKKRLWAWVPAGLTLDTYDLAVIAQDGSRGVLLDAFTVLADQPPQPTSMMPARGLNNLPVTVDIYGTNFSPKMSAELSSAAGRQFFGIEQKTLLVGVRFVNNTQLRATVRKDIPVGLYDLTVTDEAGNSAFLPAAYTALDPVTSNDLYTLGQADLWLDPPGNQAGTVPTIGLTLRRRGGQTDLENVAVDFYDGDPTAGGAYLGRGLAPLIPPNGVVTTTIFWLPSPEAGLHTLFALIDPDNVIPEDDESNNTIQHRVHIHAPDPLLQPLVITDFTINQGAAQTGQLQVYLNVTASSGGGGEAWNRRPQINQPTYLLYIEYQFVQSGYDWVQVAQSEWLPYEQAHLNYNWKLQPTPGVHYLQVWVADDEGFISPEPGLAFINYLPSEAYITVQEAHIYRYQMLAGETWLVRLTSLSGDADLYIWNPDTTLVDKRETGEAVEEIQFTASMTGVYQIEVEGFTDADYRLEVIPLDGLSRASPMVAPEQRGRGQPISDGLPDDNTGLPEIPESEYLLYLPMITH